jgi:Putative zinc-finger
MAEVMNCEQARNLFDAYLDGELSSALETELGAHRVQCDQCRHELALLEVAGHVISDDSDPESSVPDDFTDRLLACVDAPRPVVYRFDRRRWVVGVAVLAAAAMVAIAVIPRLGNSRRIAGQKVIIDKTGGSVPDDADIESGTDSLVSQVESTWKTRMDSAQTLIDVGGQTISQVLDRLGTGAVQQGDTLPESFDELAPGVAGDEEIDDL